MDLPTCVRSRATRHTVIDKLLLAVEDAIRNNDPLQVEVELEKVKQKEYDLRVVYQRMEALILADPQATDAEIIANEAYADKIIASKVVAQRYLADARNKGKTPVIATATGMPKGQFVKLPKLQIQAFKGEIGDWERFWDQFQAGVDSSVAISKIDKFNYLKSLLSDSAYLTIAGLSLTEKNYDAAVALLKDKYGRPEVLVAEHIQQLWATKKVSRVDNGVELRHTLEQFKMHINSLENLGQNIDSMAPVFCHVLLQALPRVLIIEWNRQNPSAVNNNLTKLVAFVKSEIEGIELAQRSAALQKEPIVKKEGKSEKSFTQGFTSASSLVATEDSVKPKVGFRKTPHCIFCNSQSHWASGCTEFVSNQSRRDVLRKANRCFQCFRKGHFYKECDRNVDCKACKRRHNVLLCPNRDHSGSAVNSVVEVKERVKMPQEESSKASKATLVTSTITNPKTKTVSVLQAMRLWVRHKRGLEPVTVLFDGGSERSFITADLVNKLDLKVKKKESLTVCSFGGKKEKQSSAVIQFSLVGANEMEVNIEASQVQEICSGVTYWDTGKIENFLQSKRIYSWKQSMGLGNVASVDILIGADWYWQLMTGHMKRLSGFLMATQSVFGWMLQGKVDACSPDVRIVSMLSVTLGENISSANDLEDRLAKLWELDRSGTMAKEDLETMTLQDKEVLQNFEDTTKVVEDRYQVRIPWSDKKNSLGCNYAVAKERLRRLLFKLQKDPALLQRYKNGMSEYLSNGHIEEVTEEKENPTVYYMPHHPVVKETRSTTKLRIVFDASSHESNQLSLNQCQYAGPNLNPVIFELLLRFRWHYIGIISDMEKAFLQILLAPEDRDATRFLWTEEEWSKNHEPTLKVYRMTRVLFGMKASPFLLAATIRLHARKIKGSNPDLYKQLHENTYVDDLVTGTDSAEKAYQVYQESTALMLQAGMKLQKWATNDFKLRERWKKEGVECIEDSVEVLKVLGLMWNVNEDTLSYKSEELLTFAQSASYTKRGILEILARVYDPMGFLAPKTVQAKQLLQTLWKLKLAWDDPIPETLQLQWENWIEDLKWLSSIQVPRCCRPTDSLGISYQLHVFADSSSRAYGAAAYLRASSDSGEVYSRLIAAKSRVTPVAAISIPRLELLAALVAVRLALTIKRAWNNPMLKTYAWSDSKVALCWIKGNPTEWKVFVARRVQEIQQQEIQWNYCSTKENVADLLTRDTTLQQLWTTSKWWKGPTWLSKDQSKWHSIQSDITNLELQAQVQAEKSKPIVVQLVTIKEPLFPADRFESWSRIVRITAWIKRFIRNCQVKNKIKLSYLTLEEIQQAEIPWLQYMQSLEFTEEAQQLQLGLPVASKSPLVRFNPQLDENGLIRVGGRLKYADLEESMRHPILLRGDGLAQKLIRSHHLKCCHGGVQETLAQLRNTVWVLQGRRSVRRAIRNCYICRKWAAKTPTVIEAPLPAARINQSHPFSVTGLDFAGPIWIRGFPEKTKGYICLFTCAVTRAVHLELVLSQEIRHFILAFRRFIARRGSCRIIYCDNSQTLHQTDRLLQEAYRGLHQNSVQEQAVQLGIQWRFIPPRAAWWGGVYERIVGSVKRHLRRTLGTALLEADELATILAEIEAVINNRPLISVTEDPEDSEYLTPAHFLIGRKLEALGDLIPGLNAAPLKPSLVRRWKYRKRLMQSFWNKWKEEYLLQLRSAHQVRNTDSQVDVKLGDVVLKKDEKLPRGQWKLAKIVELSPGRDGRVRSVMLELSNGQQLRRSIQHICPLEVI